MKWFPKKNKGKKLEKKYCNLMQKAYKIAPKDKAKSDLLNKEALKIKKLIQQQNFDSIL